jgi:hypothetical protein
VIPISLIQPVEASKATPGHILVASSVQVSHPPKLVVAGNRPLLLHLGGEEKSAFRVLAVGQNPNLSLAISDWKLVVDETDLVSPFSATPAMGEAFFSDGVPGIVARLDHAEAYVGLDGTLLPEPDWSKFIGFKSWKIVLQLNDCCDELVIFDTKEVADQ